MYMYNFVYYVYRAKIYTLFGRKGSHQQCGTTFRSELGFAVCESVPQRVWIQASGSLLPRPQNCSLAQRKG